MVESSPATGYSTYSFIFTNSTAGKPSYNFVSGTEFLIREFKFTGPNPSQLAQIRFADMSPTGGLTGNANFYFEGGGTEYENSPALFYGTGTNNVNNGYSYQTQSVTLPFRFVDFTVTKRDNNALLNWMVTNQDVNTHHYEIERSLNGTDFTFVTRVAADNSQLTMTYNATDANITALKSSGYLYYRIKQVDVDGHFIYSSVKTIRLDNKPITISTYPNPATDYTVLTVDLESPATIGVTVVDVNGKILQDLSFPAFKGINQQKIDLSRYATGTYMMKVNTGQESQTLSVVKMK